MTYHDEILAALQKANLAELEKLSKKCNYFPKGNDDITGASWIVTAIEVSKPNVIEWIISKHVAINFMDEMGFSLLHIAIESDNKNRYEILKLLLKYGVDVNMHGLEGWTPAHLAAARNDLEALRILAANGADLRERTGIDDNSTPLELAISMGSSTEIICFLTLLSKINGNGTRGDDLKGM